MAGDDVCAELIAARYEVVRPLGAGGMADAYQVVDQTTGAEVALKRLRFDRAEKYQSLQVALFEREYLILNELAHPRSVQVFARASTLGAGPAQAARARRAGRASRPGDGLAAGGPALSPFVRG